MIRNDRQLKLARDKVAGLEQAKDSLDDDLDRAAYDDLIDSVLSEVSEYEAIKSGVVRTFNVQSLDEVGEAVAKARIALGWTQKQLAEELGVAEQLVQKDEARDYENAGLARLAEIFDALGYEMVGCVRPKQRRFVDDFGGRSLANAVVATVQGAQVGAWHAAGGFVEALGRATVTHSAENVRILMEKPGSIQLELEVDA